MHSQTEFALKPVSAESRIKSEYTWKFGCVHGRPTPCSLSINQPNPKRYEKNPLKYLAVLTKLNKNIPVKIRQMCTMEAFPHRLSPSDPLLWRIFGGKFCSWGEELEDSGQLQIDIILELPRRE